MHSPTWYRTVAWTVLLTFSTSIVACGPSTEEPEPTTVTSVPETTAAPPPTTLPPPPPTPPPTLGSPPPEQLDRQALRELVAPVALYPDVVLASLLPATTYPEQVREAARLVGPGGTVERIPNDRDWDGSVLGLLQFPDVLRWLDAHPDWMDEMGQAVTFQQGDVLDAIQEYRQLVRKAGNLESNQYQKVSQARPDGPVRIEPARPDIVYVPSYDPAVITQPQPAQQPGISPWLAFGGGAVVGALGAWALYSIFDDDDDVREVHHYHHGRRRIHRYDNYYFARGRRPPRSEWRPRERPYRAPKRERPRPGRLEHAQVSTRPARPLPPPTSRPRRERRQEQRQLKQERQQERRQGQRQQRQERQERQQQQRMQRQQQQRERRQQHRERQQQQRMQRQQQHRMQRQPQRQREGSQAGQGKRREGKAPQQPRKRQGKRQ